MVELVGLQKVLRQQWSSWTGTLVLHTSACARLLMSASLGSHGHTEPQNAEQNRDDNEPFMHVADSEALICLENSHCSTYGVVYVPYSRSSIPGLSLFCSSQLQLQHHHEILLACTHHKDALDEQACSW